MPLNYDTIKHWCSDEIRHTYSEKDTMLYAPGIGLGENPLDPGQLRHVYEKDLQAFPTLSVVLGYPGEILAFDMWREGEEIRYTARSVERNIQTLNCGVAKVKQQ